MYCMYKPRQDRLPKELKLTGIATVEAADAFIREVYLPAHNARFAVEPAGRDRLSRPFPASISTRSRAFRRSGRSATTIASPTGR